VPVITTAIDFEHPHGLTFHLELGVEAVRVVVVVTV
jgi:hypothetical protein